VHGLYSGLPRSRSWRRYLSEQGNRPGASAEVLRTSLKVFDGDAAYVAYRTMAERAGSTAPANDAIDALQPGVSADASSV
jgi:hypothetical protein